jgi:5-methyltetrahydropteroyltriglutamate--homocysteine methyltransferase
MASDKILTTHVGNLQELNDAFGPRKTDEDLLRTRVAAVVRRQREVGLDLVCEGEITKEGIWTTYIQDRLGGFETREVPEEESQLALLLQSKDWIDYADYYKEQLAGQYRNLGRKMDWFCTAPVTYIGQQTLEREIALLKEALGDYPVKNGFLTSTAPMSLEPGRHNLYYKTQEEFVYALAEALRVEYKAIVDSDLTLQVDDAWMAALWDRIGLKMGLEQYKRYCTMRVEALNHALRGIAPEKVRYHLCWGSWHGPHSADLPMADIVDILLRVNAQTYLFEAGNARHEHEFNVWRDVTLPSDKILAPGVVSHCTPVMEHPELVSLRIRRFADIVGRERVIASTDCGLGLRCHPSIAWGKLQTLTEGAALATRVLWGSRSAT